jgi:hypothetical protein
VINQFQLQTDVETVIAFLLDVHGTAWKTISPNWIVANGTVDEFQDEEFYFVNARSVEKIPLPFQLSI